MLVRFIVAFAASFLVVGSPLAMTYTTVALPSLNTNIGTWTGGSVYESVFTNSISTWNNVPFLMAESGTGNKVFMGTADIPVNVHGVSVVHTIMNSARGTANAVVGTIEFFGSSGAYQKVSIVEGKHIRDHNTGSCRDNA